MGSSLYVLAKKVLQNGDSRKYKDKMLILHKHTVAVLHNYNESFQSDSYFEVSTLQPNQKQYTFPHLTTKCTNTTDIMLCIRSPYTY